jgi:hypothetical protein
MPGIAPWCPLPGFSYLFPCPRSFTSFPEQQGQPLESSPSRSSGIRFTSACMDRTREFETDLGHFSFTRIPHKVFYAEVTRIEKQERNGPGRHAGDSLLIASPPKALADYVYTHRVDWASSVPVLESLRVDENSLAGIHSKECFAFPFC